MNTTMTSTKICIKNAIALSTICVASVVGSLAFGHSASAQYGLGLPKSASSGGATRGDLPLLTILAPEDGAKTLSSRPTFYWYIAPQDNETKTSTTIPLTDHGKGSVKVTFFLREGSERSAKSIFVAEGRAEGSGLYKFTLPENAPKLVEGKLQRWQIRWQESGGQVDISAYIRRDDNPAVLNALSSAKNDLEKARVYAKNAYWYDAIDAYTSWLSKNPKDDVAITERSNLVKSGLNNNSAFMKRDAQGKTIIPTELDPTKLSSFLTKLAESRSADSILLQPKIVIKSPL
jgi:hypothetical protein